MVGGLDVMAAAGCTVLGGHSIDGPEPHYGFAVTGLAGPGGVKTNAGARPGNVLVLTKPLGSGIVSTAMKRGKCPEGLASDAIEMMASLNGPESAYAVAHQATAMTDVTGFGLLGHLQEMTRASGVGAVVHADSVPVLDGVRQLLSLGMWASVSGRNLAVMEDQIEIGVDRDVLKILVDAQTSGGLLIALPAPAVAPFMADLPSASAIGVITEDLSISVIP
jgi:selenide,water dikinase